MAKGGHSQNNYGLQDNIYTFKHIFLKWYLVSYITSIIQSADKRP